MRTIDKIIVHCTAGSQKNTAADVVRLHTMPKSRGGNGWKVAGYHYIIEASGKIVSTVPDAQVSNGCYGQNQHSINVCYIGGVDMTTRGLPPLDNRTPEQKSSLRKLLVLLRQKFPNAKIMGHRSIWGEDTPSKWKKSCPCFNAIAEYADI